MDVISLPRKAGKTTLLIVQSHQIQIPIVVTNQKQAKEIYTRSKEIGLKIPYPLTVAELTERPEHFPQVKEILVDEAGIILETFLNKKIRTMTITRGE